MRDKNLVRISALMAKVQTNEPEVQKKNKKKVFVTRTRGA